MASCLALIKQWGTGRRYFGLSTLARYFGVQQTINRRRGLHLENPGVVRTRIQFLRLGFERVIECNYFAVTGA